MNKIFTLTHLCGHKIEYENSHSFNYLTEFMKSKIKKESCPYCKPNCSIDDSFLYLCCVGDDPILSYKLIK